MKSLYSLIVLLLLFAYSGCKSQKKDIQEKKQQSSNSGELVFGDKKLTYFMEGEGFPCFVCADGDLQKNCISDNLKDHFQFVFMEQRHSNYYQESKDYSKITMDTIVNDLETLRLRLGFDKVYVFGHSIIGLITLEYARKYPESTKGVIMVNTPSHFNMDYMHYINNYWDENASEERKKILMNNKKNLQTINKDSISNEQWNHIFYKARVPKDWYNPLFDVSEVYPNFRINDEGWNHFYSIMREYDIARSQIETPIFLSLGKFDFMVPAIIWNDYESKLPTLKIYNFEASGHFPHVEEQELFDKQLLNWIKDK